MTYSANTIRESSKKVFSSQKFEVEADSKGNHYVTRKSDGQMVSFVGDVIGNRVFKRGNDITDNAIHFWSVHDSWFGV